MFNDDDGSYGTNGRGATAAAVVCVTGLSTASLGGYCGGDLNGVVLQRR